MALSREETEALRTLGSMVLGGAMRGAGGYDGKHFGPGFAARPGGRIWNKEGERNDGKQKEDTKYYCRHFLYIGLLHRFSIRRWKRSSA